MVRSNTKKNSKRGHVSTNAVTSNVTSRSSKTRVNNGNHLSNSKNHHHQQQQHQPQHGVRHRSTSDNDQKEGEEWETASESSTNMRNGHYDSNGTNNVSTNTMKSMPRGRTPPKKSFSSQR
jgi:hypothetical protein